MRIGFLIGAFSTGAAQAHEFWLLPDDFTPMSGAPLAVELRNGEKMKGMSLNYLPGNITRFEMVTGSEAIALTGRLGDMPALTTTAPGPGLAVLLHETTDATVTYKDHAQFTRFATHKAAAEMADLHLTRGLPLTGFKESYRRYAKSLIAVGDGPEAWAGADRALGLRIEIVALANPYVDDVTEGLPLEVRLDGQPRAMAQIELFAQAPDGTVTVTRHTTDAAGRAVVPVQPGMTYLADNVDLYPLPNEDATAGPVWHSDWASLTWAVP